ncbi:homoserine O-acetyltransferase MetX [Agromyces archimandritae]|uniref:Homoserine O-acetyltransferase n=1 Tax=Agromyces archimandritae TaxID=2781962 RepID=A0A975IP22_9MICO|nr:homoserine O-acetyltransferase [Agromyces archimandritae]QTX05198.1 homoserine O-acetyltransferase [Agromyces archimandritae]
MDWQTTADTAPGATVPAGPVPMEAGALPGRAPATGAWREGDPVGERRFADLGRLDLESGRSLPAVRLAYEQFGTLSPAGDNAILVLHALTGDAHVSGVPGPGQASTGWWNGLVGPGRAVDTDRWFVLAPNVLGGCQGSTGPASLAPDGLEWGSRFPAVTIRDQVAAQARLAEALGIRRFAAVVGGSMGGMHVLEWAVTHPDRVERIAVLAAPAETTADQIARNSVQLEAVRLDPGFRGGEYYDAADGDGPHRGLALARRMAMLNYRTAGELDERFARQWQSELDPLGGGRFAVESYLDFHGNRFTRRFDANSYLVLTEAMNSHDLGRGRGGVDAALDAIGAKSLVLGVDTDRYFPLDGQRRIARRLRGSVHGPEPVVVDSPFGHDAFLIEDEAVGAALGALLAA